ncbi:MAG: prepilin-type N-terminal cleavage/methylation domain-containing protein [Acidithiobacillus ferriphilus]|uniref:type II secretion system protein n=1 Tax=Acidithiobacillus ferriphilus TaxID=1689834 RepID=UPI001C069713|nr:type II secretion system protein [Acidithiobacillus ferriphilus]MBU2834104.1 type II secretion system protein [Acidithiobacillus ferriphilus]
MTQYRGGIKGIAQDQAGLTLVELLISMVIAGIIGIAVLSILYTMYNGRTVSEKLTGRSSRTILMKEALEHTVTDAGYTAYTSSSSTATPCTIANPVILPALPVAPSVSSLTVSWTVDSGGVCNTCSGTFSISGNTATWNVTGGNSCGQSNTSQTATFPVGTGWTLSAASYTSCLGPAFNNTTAPAVIATNMSSQYSGTNPVEVSACLFNLQGQ